MDIPNKTLVVLAMLVFAGASIYYFNVDRTRSYVDMIQATILLATFFIISVAENITLPKERGKHD